MSSLSNIFIDQDYLITDNDGVILNLGYKVSEYINIQPHRLKTKSINI